MINMKIKKDFTIIDDSFDKHDFNILFIYLLIREFFLEY